MHLDCDVAREPGDSVTLSDDVHMAQAARIDAQILIAAFQVGLAQGAVELGSAYAESRQQFGRVIGSFQAVKHLLVDAVVGTEVARAGVHAAAVTIDEDRVDTDRPLSIRSDDRLEQIAAGARVVASRAAHRAATACIQVHGGIGYTWELEAHLYLKRSLVLDEMLGGVGEAIGSRRRLGLSSGRRARRPGQARSKDRPSRSIALPRAMRLIDCWGRWPNCSAAACRVMRPRAVLMRVVGLEHDVVEPDAVEHLDADRVLEEAAVDLAVVVGRRRLRAVELRVAPPAVRLPHVVDALEQVRDPADLASAYSSFRSGYRCSTPENRKSVRLATLLPKMIVAATASGASGDVCGVLVPDPMCMQITVPVSSHAWKNGSQWPV